MARMPVISLDHRNDVQLAGNRWPQSAFARATRITREAIARRESRRPGERAFDYPPD